MKMHKNINNESLEFGAQGFRQPVYVLGKEK